MLNDKAVSLRGRDARIRAAELGDVRSFGRSGSADTRCVRIADLVLSDSPRTTGENDDHARTLAEAGTDLPPIVVQRGTNRVVDGRHRVRAAHLRGQTTIRARYFDGDDDAAFVLAVHLNARHGLPLSLADRKKAAERILVAHPVWSNRAIASVAGISHKTVATLRQNVGVSAGQARIGRDGRRRPLSATAGRERARRILEEDQTSSLREVSAIAGVSPGPVRDVRDQLRRQASEAVPGPRADPDAAVPAGRGGARQRDSPSELDAALRVLRADPALRFTQSGRLLLSILAVAPLDAGAYDRLIVDLPDHCVGPVAELAAASVEAWQEFATRLDRRRSIDA